MDEAQSTVDGITSKFGQLDTIDPGAMADDLANEGSQHFSDLSEGILSKFTKPMQPDSEFGNEFGKKKYEELTKNENKKEIDSDNKRDCVIS